MFPAPHFCDPTVSGECFLFLLPLMSLFFALARKLYLGILSLPACLLLGPLISLPEKAKLSLFFYTALNCSLTRLSGRSLEDQSIKWSFRRCFSQVLSLSLSFSRLLVVTLSLFSSLTRVKPSLTKSSNIKISDNNNNLSDKCSFIESILT